MKFKIGPIKLFFMLLGVLLVGGSIWLPLLKQNGFEPLGPIIDITLIVFSLFGELPSWLSWTQKLGSVFYPGIALGTILLLIPLLIPSGAHQSSAGLFSGSFDVSND